MNPLIDRRWHVVVPFWLLGLALTLVYSFGADFALADELFRLEGGSWQFRDQWLFADVFHRGGRTFSAVLAVILLVALGVAASNKRYRHFLPGLGMTTGVILIGLGIVNGLKAWTDGSCPWDLARYGGLLSQDAANVFNGVEGGGRCFPAGHASGGYAWLALYFLARMYAPKWRFAGLFLGLSMGLVFGVAQQLRGAHFLSHDLWTAAICWFTAVAGFSWLARGTMPQQALVASAIAGDGSDTRGENSAGLDRGGQSPAGGKSV